MKLRLLLTQDCNRSCRLCCNKDFDLDALPKCDSLAGYNEIMITGGEPLLYPKKIFEVVEAARRVTSAPIYIYTASRNPLLLRGMLAAVDGITLTLHSRADTAPFKSFLDVLRTYPTPEPKSLRLNVFKGVSTGAVDLSAWKVKRGMRWLKDCPLPEGEVFQRWAGAEALREVA